MQCETFLSRKKDYREESEQGGTTDLCIDSALPTQPESFHQQDGCDEIQQCVATTKDAVDGYTLFQTEIWIISLNL